MADVGIPKTRNRTPTPRELGQIKVLASCVMAMDGTNTSIFMCVLSMCDRSLTSIMGVHGCLMAVDAMIGGVSELVRWP